MQEMTISKPTFAPSKRCTIDSECLESGPNYSTRVRRLTGILRRARVKFSNLAYCQVDKKGTGASRRRGACARDFVNFLHVSGPRGARRAGLTVYPPLWDVAAASSQSCDRQSKFGLRHAI
jgi:hypothetical protein